MYVCVCMDAFIYAYLHVGIDVSRSIFVSYFYVLMSLVHACMYAYVCTMYIGLCRPM